jgi:hypothetical protein
MLICTYFCDGSDGTRARDLRRDQAGHGASRAQREWAGISGVSRTSRCFACGDCRGAGGSLRRPPAGYARDGALSGLATPGCSRCARTRRSEAGAKAPLDPPHPYHFGVAATGATHGNGFRLFGPFWRYRICRRLADNAIEIRRRPQRSGSLQASMRAAARFLSAQSSVVITAAPTGHQKKISDGIPVDGSGIWPRA